ncbi:MAG: hypothetical protein IPM34_13550 [Saprospiraceae bacterium]|nr:hypothetical protein [Saprospiraceae bacterium]
MKTILSKSLSFFAFLFVLTISSNLAAQNAPTKSTAPVADADYSKVTPSGKRGEVTKETDCVDLIVRKGCVKYAVSVPADAKKSPDMIQVCAQGKELTDVKKVDICRPGATKITVKYEKIDDDALIEFIPRKPTVKKHSVNKTMEKQN